MVTNNINEQNTPPIQAGNISRDGFLGADRRPLAEIIRADEEDLKKLNLTHQAIAGRMKFFRDRGKDGLGEIVPVAPHFEVSCEITRGFLPCPFGEPGRPACNATVADSIACPQSLRSRRCRRAGRHRKTIVTARNLRLQKEIVFSDLNIHLIAVHSFYEGKGSLFRLEPLDLAEILEIGKEEQNGSHCRAPGMPGKTKNRKKR